MEDLKGPVRFIVLNEDGSLVSMCGAGYFGEGDWWI